MTYLTDDDLAHLIEGNSPENTNGMDSAQAITAMAKELLQYRNQPALDRVRAGIHSRLDDIAARRALGNISHAGHMYEIADAWHAARREAGE